MLMSIYHSEANDTFKIKIKQGIKKTNIQVTVIHKLLYHTSFNEEVVLRLGSHCETGAEQIQSNRKKSNNDDNNNRNVIIKVNIEI